MKSNKHKIHISNGPTFKLGFLGGLIIVASIVIGNEVSFYHAIPSFYIGFVVTLSIQGVIIDTKRKRIKPYIHLLFFRVGAWKSTNVYEKIILTLYSNTSTYGSRYSQATVRTRSYNLCLVDKYDDQLKFVEYTDYNKALGLAKRLSKKLNIPFENHFEEMMESLAERRASMGR